jgi:hypothetical protein
MSASDSDEPKPPGGDNEANDRRAANIFLAVAAIILIGAGVWLVDAMIAAKKADECISAGRRNCTPIDVPTR